MDVFDFRNRLIGDYEQFSRSFTRIQADDIGQYVDKAYAKGKFWPAPLVQLNPNFLPGQSIDQLVDKGILEKECRTVFRAGKANEPGSQGKPMRLHKHQEDAIHTAQRGDSYVLTTGTGSGKSLAYFIPIVDDVLKRRRQGGIVSGTTAIVVYPMNALCNSQLEELQKFLRFGYDPGKESVTFARYTGQESKQERERIAANPPDILLTNYVMLELLMTRQDPTDLAVIKKAQGLRFLVLDELHTYRGRQGADVAMLVRRVRERFNPALQCIGTSATMASEGSVADRNHTVADIASRLFGTPVKPESIIVETLSRVTPAATEFSRENLASAIDADIPHDVDYDRLKVHPIAAWIETRLGLALEDGRWVRTTEPLSIQQAAEQLAQESGIAFETCKTYLAEFLLLAYQTKDAAGRSLFAFRLHQFISGAGDLYSSLEAPDHRFLTLNGQQYQPGDRSKRLFNVCFCRECGQEYFPLWATLAGKQPVAFEPRQLTERSHENDELQFGYFMPDADAHFAGEDLENGCYPEEWIDFSAASPRLKPNYRKYQPLKVNVDTLGQITERGLPGWYIPHAFRFCLHCGVAYEGAVRSDLTKLASLSSEGRSSATSVLTLAALRYMLGTDNHLDAKAKKLLGFTDNRQDASLQAGHFNDFIQVLILRGALLAAIRNAPQSRLTDDVLTQQVQTFLRLTPADYATNPDAKGVRARNTETTLRDVLGYRLYNDLERGWRITNPNLEQLKLLEISYESLDECCADQEVWQGNPLLAATPPEKRQALLHEVLDLMRRHLCIKTIYLNRYHQEQIRNRSFSALKEPWGFSEDDKLYSAAVMVPRPAPRLKTDHYVYAISHRSAFGRRLRRKTVWGENNPHYPERFTESTYNDLIDAMLAALETYGLVEADEISRELTGYRVDASVMQWREGDSAAAQQTNPFFRALYENIAGLLSADERYIHQLEAREHTAQVDSDTREQREQNFRTAKLPVLFCSPTMELGVDIATLNTVYMRNVPPTPANYAQRSGRAGRSGQPALVITYCAAKSPHDQYFFQEPTRMVSGVVNAPALDLANEDLVRSHLNAVWLAETGQKLEPSIKNLLDLNQDETLPLRPELEENLKNRRVRERTTQRAERILATVADELTAEAAPWYAEGWLDMVIAGTFQHFKQTFDRWRSLYQVTRRQLNEAHAIKLNHAATEQERRNADQRYQDADSQLNLLQKSAPTLNSDFYTYRYLATEGFLPGYNFPRLPLLAFIHGHREKAGQDSFLSRPRFLGLSEFGPQSIIYHEGNKHRVTSVMLGIRDGSDVNEQLPVRSAQLCPACGYAHFDAEKDFERCVNCNALLNGGKRLPALYRIEQVNTRRATRITSDEEERQRQGYETITTLRFAQSDGQPRYLSAVYQEAGETLLQVRFAPAATLWRINLGWRRRKEKSIYGFHIDVTSGMWSKDEQTPEDADENSSPIGKAVQRIIPYVEDRKNCLLVTPVQPLEPEAMITFQYALKRGIEACFQLENSELAVEALPDQDQQSVILLYEAAEGGAGVLARFATDPTALQRVARHALEICHYTAHSDRWSGLEDLHDTDGDCEAGCYKCLLSYTNQPHHGVIDRKNEQVRILLCQLTRCEIDRRDPASTDAQRFSQLDNLSVSSLEQAWLKQVREKGYHLPDKAQPLLEEHRTQADFGYSNVPALIYIDGPHHDSEHQQKIDQGITERLEDAGYAVIRFPKERHRWPELFAQHPYVFGHGAD